VSRWVGRDVGLSDDVIGYVLARQRKALLDRFPDLLNDAVPDALGTVARCSVCASPERHRIEAALAAGTSYRDIAATLAVSRSALTRHNAHQRALIQ
jgi:hypothetical protein